MTMIYLAYGADVDTIRMADRHPTARLIGGTELKNYRLVFKGCKGDGTASIEPFKGDSVPAVLWEVAEPDTAALDSALGFPDHAEKETLTVTVDRKRVKAVAYVCVSLQTGAPCRYYANLMRRGYRRFGFDEQILNRAIEAAMKEREPDDA